MAVLFLDDNFDIVSPPKSDFFSMIWELNYYELGKFSLEAHPDYFPFAQTASYLYSNENDRTGKITGMEFNDQKSSVKISGLCIECLLEDRVITQKETVVGNLEAEIGRLVKKYAIDTDPSVPLLELGEFSGFPATIDTEVQGENLSEWLYETLQRYEMSYRIQYDYLQNKLIFSLVKGLDRTQSQNQNSWAIFSSSYRNIVDSIYELDRTDEKNCVYVSGHDGNDLLKIDLSYGSPIREIYVEANNLKPQENDEDQFVICGANGALCAATSDVNLANKTSGTDRNLLACTYLNGRYFACGEQGAAVWSEDGTRFSTAATGTTASLQGACYWNGQYLAAGSEDTILLSSNGTDWELHHSGAGQSTDWNGVAYIKDRYFLVGTNGLIAHSIDGLTWETQTVDPLGRTLYGIAYLHYAYWIVGEGGLLFSSHDAEHWSRRETNTVQSLYSIAYGTGRWVVAGANSTLLSSQDGDTWTPCSLPTVMDLTGICYGNGLFLAIGNQQNMLLKSNDGVVWTKLSHNFSGVPQSITFGLSQYHFALYLKGIEKLQKYQKVESIRVTASPKYGMIYKQNYDLGDLCNYENTTIGISASSRITQITEVTENGTTKVVPKFGEDFINLRKHIKREAI